MNKKQRVVLIVLLVMFISVLGLTIWAEQSTSIVNNEETQKNITLSQDSGFYKEAFKVHVKATGAKEIYYTLDGSVPSKENPEATLFTEKGVEIPCDDVEKAYNLKCIAYYMDGSASEVVCKSYITGLNVDERFDLQVLNVSGDPHDFYNYEDGILTYGKLDEEFLASNPHVEEWVKERTFPSYGNMYQTGRESEKPVYMTLFDENGDVLVAQNCGFRLYGGYSRSKNQPSFRLYARREYDEQNDFDYVFFDNQYRADGSILIDKYQRLVVRNNGNDNGYAFIRNELSTKLAIDAGFQDVQASTPVCVYLNGEYYGVLWLMANFDDEYFEQTYGEYDGEMFVFEGKASELESDETEGEAYQTLVNEYNEKQAFFATCDLNEEANWAALNQFIDVENYLHYMAIQHYIANYDTLVNNYKLYRYYDANGNYTENSVFDGKFRFLLFDLDYSFGLMEYHRYVESIGASFTAERMTSGDQDHQFFANVMSREDCKEQYIRYFLACMNYYYAKDYVTPILNELHEKRYDELNYAISQNLFLNNFCALDVTSMEQVEVEMAKIHQFMKERPGHAFYDLVKAFGTLTPYSLNLQNDSLATVQIDSANVTLPSLSGIYLVELPPVLKVIPAMGYKFSHWLVNGEAIYEKEFVVEETMVKDYVLDVACVCVPDEEAGIVITAVKPKGGADYVELTNFGTETVNLGAYTLSDSNGKRKSVLPAMDLKPQESITIYCKNYTGAEALGNPGTNFNISVGETISLYNDETCLSAVEVPDLGSRDGVYRMDVQNGEFREVLK